MYEKLLNKEAKLAVIGLGYVGLPIALEFAKHLSVIGFDINQKRVDMMNRGEDPSKELDSSEFENKDIVFTATLEDLREANFFIVAVPTPIDEHNKPDLTPLLKSSETVGKVLKKGDYVVYESTVYPGWAAGQWAMPLCTAAPLGGAVVALNSASPISKQRKPCLKQRKP